MTPTAALLVAVDALRPLVDGTPADKDVKAGWTAFGVFVFLCVAVVVLGFSLVKHLRRAEDNLAPRPDPEADGPERRPGA